MTDEPKPKPKPADDTIRIGVRVSPGNFMFCLACGLAVLLLAAILRTVVLKMAADDGNDPKSWISVKFAEQAKGLSETENKFRKLVRGIQGQQAYDFRRLKEELDQLHIVRPEDNDPEAKWFIRTDVDGERRDYRCLEYKELSAGDGFALLELDFGDGAKVRIRCKWYEAMTPCPKAQEGDGDTLEERWTPGPAPEPSPA